MYDRAHNSLLVQTKYLVQSDSVSLEVTAPVPDPDGVLLFELDGCRYFYCEANPPDS